MPSVTMFPPARLSGAKNAHDLAAEQLAVIFRTTTKVKTQQSGSGVRGAQRAAFLADAAGPDNLVQDMCIAHERWGSSSNPLLNGHVHYPLPADIDKPLNEAAADKIRDYRAHYNNRPSNSISFEQAHSGKLKIVDKKFFFFVLLPAQI